MKSEKRKVNSCGNLNKAIKNNLDGLGYGI